MLGLLGSDILAVANVECMRKPYGSYRCIENESKAESLAVVKDRGRKRFVYLNDIKVYSPRISYW